jgi:hypothetical protein
MITHNSIGYGGRLGNQLFQLSALLGVAYKNNYIPSIPVEKNKQVKPNGCLDMFTGKWISYKLDLFDCFDVKINDSGDTIASNSYKEPHHHFDESIFNVSDNTNIEGYFQSEKYFEHIKDIIRGTFVFKKEIKDKALDIFNKNKKTDIISIHIRRGDYLGIQHQFPIMDASYYQNAINEIYDNNDYQYFIFSDDIAWCKEVFGESDSIYYSEGNSHYVDLCLMTMCNHNIIGNSTFGWWGSWLNNNPNKKVVVPKQWFGPALGHLDTKDMTPKEWIKI